MSDQARFVLESLKQNDPERYLCALYLPQSIRQDVAAIWAFDAEVARIPDLVSEPLPGEIRLQWWRDLIRSGDNSGSGPLARALMSTISKHDLPREVFDTYLDARIFDLYQDPMPDQGSFEGYLGETVSCMLHMSGLCDGAVRSTELADACGYAGMAIGIKTLLANAAKHISRKQQFFPTPLESASDVSEYTNLAQQQLADARQAIEMLPIEQRRIFLPLCFVSPIINSMRKDEGRCLQQPFALSPLRRQWAVFRASLRSIP